MGKVLDNIKGIASKRGISLTSFSEDRLRGFEREFERGSLDMEGLLNAVQNEFGYKWERNESEELRKKIERN